VELEAGWGEAEEGYLMEEVGLWRKREGGTVVVGRRERETVWSFT